MRNAGHRKFIRVMQTLISVKGLAGEPDERKRSSPVRGGDAGKVPFNGNSPATYSTLYLTTVVIPTKEESRL